MTIDGPGAADERARIAKAREAAASILRKAGHVKSLGGGPLERLAWWLKDAPYKGIRSIQTGFLAERERLNRIFAAAEALLVEIEAPRAGDPPALAHLAREIIQPVRVLRDLARDEVEKLPAPEPRAWKVFAQIFYDLAVQCWVEGGADFFRGKVPQFGIGDDGKATKAVQELLRLAGWTVEASTLAKVLRGFPAPPPWIPDGGAALLRLAGWEADASALEKALRGTPIPDAGPGRDFDALHAGEWGFDDKKRRVLLNKSQATQETQGAEPKKKRGRPRKS